MRSPVTFLAVLLTAACGGKDSADDSSSSGTDDTSVAESKPEDSNEPVDDGRLRPGFWAFTVAQVFVNQCGLETAEGDILTFEVREDEEGNHRLGPAVVINYGDPGNFSVNGLEIRFRDDGDCQTDIQIASSGTYTDWETIDAYGRDENHASTGSECADWAINGGEDCRFDARFTGEWIGDQPPE